MLISVMDNRCRKCNNRQRTAEKLVTAQMQSDRAFAWYSLSDKGHNKLDDTSIDYLADFEWPL